MSPQKFCCIAILVVQTGCALLGGKQGEGSSTTAFELTQDAFVSSEKMPRTLKKKGAKLDVTDGVPISIEWPGFRGVVVVPAVSAEPVKITLKPLDGVETTATPQLRGRVGSELNRLIAKVNEVQWLSATKRTDVALKMLEDLESVYPDVTYLGFMKASLLLMRGDQPKAIAALESALREFPENESGQKLYRKLTGDEKKSKTRAPSMLLDDDLLDMSNDNVTVDTTSTPGAVVPPLPQVDAKPAGSPALPQALLTPPVPAAPPPLPKDPGAAAPMLPSDAEDAFGEGL